MQRCPYLTEMRERFWTRSTNNGNDKKATDDEGTDDLLKSVAMTTKNKQSTIARLAQPEPDDPDEASPMLPSNPTVSQMSTSPPSVPLVVKVKPDGSGSHRTEAADRPHSFIWIQQPSTRKWCCNYALTKFPKNAKTSLFIITSALYCKLAVVVCLAFLLSEVITLNVPLHFFEAIFTYLYSGSILFFLYVFCYLLHDTSQKKRQKNKEAASAREARTDEEVAADASASKSGERKQSFLQESRHKAKYDVAGRERLDIQNEGMLKGIRKGSESKDVNLNDGSGEAGGPAPSQGQEKATAEPSSAASCGAKSASCKPKTSQSDTAHGSFFLRMGTLAFGLGAMIYIGLELGSFFEIPMGSSCYNILRGVNPLLQLIFTFMQMYFIFINARLRIHKFKIIARFGLMHVVATNLCVWLRILVRECLKEITKHYGGVSQDYMIREGNRLLYARLGIWNQSSSTTPDPNGYDNGYNNNYGYGNVPRLPTPLPSFTSNGTTTTPLPLNTTCERTMYMGPVVDDAAPYLFPVVIEYSLIAAAVVFVMWRNIGRNIPAKTNGEEGDEGQQEWEGGADSYSRYAAGGEGTSPTGPVDCVGASKGLFCGLLLLVTALICLILFFVLVEGKQLKWLAIYLADCSHAGLLLLSFLATLIGFIRVRRLRFHGDHGSPLRDLLLRVSILGVFAYALFSLISGTVVGLSLDIPSLLVAGTSGLVLLQIILQMLFISDVGRRRINLPEHSRTKPGRQIVTLLMITNLTMWVIMTLEIRKVEKDPIQLYFFGTIPWILVQRFSLPLYIFHRFFSAVTLAEIWKNSYTLKYIPVATGP
ncbi:proton channel OtopLc isoform X3 [Folsomia candida]|uniref:proton channel OtopLc isoform X3 n=1 Tax=Folsomia candida TaxID=158441 RepID=UPI000B8F796C|nr:proton channel OtopLc isoform X3 [Folsomia candida]XP_035713156.1 proton channel OtopLc isoform X3 [Folsomia candida]XP_035713157.1 proton channel OtopLc isoform X3 [Folsomia candida]XP_035713158.1 proton channel OtopLc isoform X3 [Folsomia candida]XP_035713159.1 proton channel OtopLc isoform X3 [Folsomia candida]